MFGRTKRKKTWNDLSTEQKRGIGLAATVQVALLLFALYDWFRRPSDEMRGPKFVWLPLLFVNFIGPLSYLRFGRVQVRRG